MPIPHPNNVGEIKLIAFLSPEKYIRHAAIISNIPVTTSLFNSAFTNTKRCDNIARINPAISMA